MRRVLVLRPEPGASATVGQARGLGLEVVSAPLFEVEPIGWEAPDPAAFDGLLLTSANAVRHAGEQLQLLHGLPVYAVGEATAEAALHAGFEVIVTGDKGVDGLLGSIRPDVSLLHLSGADRREPQGAPQHISRILVYRSKAIDDPDLSGAAYAVALIHSPRAGRRFAELVADRGSIAIVAISRAAAQAVGQGWEAVTIADQPTDEALLALAAALCNKPDPQ
jgi:uroporphyrinogen-III synthase